METLTFGKCTKTILKKTFGLRQIWQSEQLDELMSSNRRSYLGCNIRSFGESMIGTKPS